MAKTVVEIMQTEATLQEFARYVYEYGKHQGTR